MVGPGAIGRLKPGAQFNRYQIVSHIALGGMADVWLGRATSVRGFGKQVAVKTMLPHLTAKPSLVEMFVREAALAARLEHPNIVQVFDFGELEGQYFMAMEYLAGRTLRDVARRLA